jgi:hypothetical protein
VVTAAAQAMYVDGYRSRLDATAVDATGDDADPDTTEAVGSPPWKAWLANGMDRRQIALHRAMLAYGHALHHGAAGL